MEFDDTQLGLSHMLPSEAKTDAHGYMFIDHELIPQRADPFHYRVKRWRPSTIGKILNRSIYKKCGSFWTGRVKDAELAFYIRNNIEGVTDDTVCLIGAHWRGRAIKIYDTEYRQIEGLLYEKRT